MPVIVTLQRFRELIGFGSAVSPIVVYLYVQPNNTVEWMAVSGEWPDVGVTEKFSADR